MKSRLQTFNNKLQEPVSAAPFLSFRMVFGLLMAFSTLRFVLLGWIEDHYSEPHFHFHYFGFDWIPESSASLLYLLHLIMFVSAIGVMTGRFYRISAISLFLIFSYTELIDLTYYLNHYYFVSLVCFWLAIIPEPDKNSKIPYWCIFIFKFQLILVYLYAGLAKINADWLLQAMPLKIWLPAHDDLFLIGPLLTLPATAYVFSWFGMIYDCSIAFLLLYKPSRPFAYITVIVFHVLTGLLFQIGVFPLVMIGATLIFFSEEWHKSLLQKIKAIPLLGSMFVFSSSRESQFRQSVITPVFKVLFVSYLLFQILFPWRYLLYPGNLFWTEEGYRFSWRVMLMEKAGDATFYVKDSKTGREGIVDNREFLNAHQEKQMSFQPDMILQFAHFLGEHYERQGVSDPLVRAEVYVTLNAQPSKLLIDPNVDLMKQEDTWSRKSWILPY
ncbi:MAG: HTTM domain-containing protein [Bacteroidia bacterium]